ncbi:MAG: arginine deiminase family protein, partial [Promethearchaeota archaeon]
QKIYPHLEYITEPGTLEGGDIMRIENHYYIGLSNRTNSKGAKQLIKILQQYGYEGTVVPLKEMLHLKTGVNYLGNNIVLVSGEFITHKEFQKFEKIIVQPDEEYAANCVRINDFVLMPAGFPKLKDELLKKDFQIIELEMSEFQKLDGGLSCLSLRF